MSGRSLKKYVIFVGIGLSIFLGIVLWINNKNKKLYTKSDTLCLSGVPNEYMVKSTGEFNADYQKKIKTILTNKHLLSSVLTEMEYDLDIETLKKRIEITFSGTLIEISVQDDNEYRTDYLCRLLCEYGRKYLEKNLELKVYY